MHIREINVSIIPSENNIRVSVQNSKVIGIPMTDSRFNVMIKPFVQALFLNSLRVSASNVYATALYNTAFLLSFRVALSSAYYLHIQKNNITLRMPLFMAKLMSIVSVPVEMLNIGSALGCSTRGQINFDSQFYDSVKVFSRMDAKELCDIYEDVGLKLSRTQVLKLQSNIVRLFLVDDRSLLFDNITNVLSSMCTFVGTTPCVSFDAVHRTQSVLSHYKFRNYGDGFYAISARGLSSYSSEVNKDITFIFLKLFQPVYEYEDGSLLPETTLPSDVVIDLTQATYFEAFSSLLSMQIDVSLDVPNESSGLPSSSSTNIGRVSGATNVSGFSLSKGNSGLRSIHDDSTSTGTGQNRFYSLGIDRAVIKVKLLKSFNDKIGYVLMS
jgi:hypothetical protein